MNDILSYVKEILSGMFTAEDSVWAGLLGLFPEEIAGYVNMALPYVGMALCVIVLFWGQKTLPFLKGAVSFFLGFFASMYWLIPMIESTGVLASVPWFAVYVVAAFVAIVAAVFNRFFYILIYAGAFGGGVFAFLYFGALPFSTDGFTFEGNALFSALVAIVVLVAAFYFRDFIEKFATAGVAATAFFMIVTRATVISQFYGILCHDVAGSFGPYIKFVIIGIFTLIGLIAQLKSVRKYRI